MNFMDLLDEYLELAEEMKDHECDGYQCGMGCCPISNHWKLRDQLVEMTKGMKTSKGDAQDQ